ncbi:MAG TPA: hypothetical protein VGD13_08065 [Xanthobacteraceae bacterium]|jgi:hypothetical protein
MTLLTHSSGSFKPARLSPRGQATTGSSTANAHLAMIRRFSIGALAAVGAIAAIIALKAALFVWIYHYY